MSTEITDKDIALDLLISSKATIATMVKVIIETSNSELREILKNQLTASLNSHYRLSDISIEKGWYNPQSEAEEQLKESLAIAKQITQ